MGPDPNGDVYQELNNVTGRRDPIVFQPAALHQIKARANVAIAEPVLAAPCLALFLFRLADVRIRTALNALVVLGVTFRACYSYFMRARILRFTIANPLIILRNTITVTYTGRHGRQLIMPT
jgi:hypothetical protein